MHHRVHKARDQWVVTMGPANPLLALFLEQQIRQQIAFQQAQNQISELVVVTALRGGMCP